MDEDDKSEIADFVALQPDATETRFTDALDALTDPGMDQNMRAKAIDQIIDRMTTDHMEIISMIANLVALRQVATGYQSFTAWLGTPEAHRVSHSHAIAAIVDSDAGWPRSARLHTELRDYIAQNHPHAIKAFDSAWNLYRSWVLAPYGDASTIRTEMQYAARIAWKSGYDEIHPETANGVSRSEAQRCAQLYNENAVFAESHQERHPHLYTTTETGSSASVARRAVVYGPWYTV